MLTEKERKRLREYRRNRYQNDPEWRERIKKIASKSRTKQYRKIMKEIKHLLGDKCVKCGFSDTRALQIDHIHGKGSQKRRNSHKSIYSYYRDILKAIKKGSKEYQLLCANCNWIKRHEKSEK